MNGRARELFILALAGALTVAVGVSACGSAQPNASATPAITKTLVHVALSGPLSGSFATCSSNVDGDDNWTVLRGAVVDASGVEVGTAKFGLVHVGRLAPGAYILGFWTDKPTGSRAVGTLTISPLAGRRLPVITVGQKYGGASQAIFLTQDGTLEVASDGSMTITAELIDLQATQQVSDHPVISGTWQCPD